jgi:hypothetical protein
MNNTRHFIFEKRGDYLVWSANNREVDAGNVAEVVDQYRNSERELTIYSGTHGDPGGNFSGVGYAEREFAYEDRENLPGNVKVVNVGRNKIDVKKTIDEATTDSLFGWCFSNRSETGKSPYKS